MKTREFTEKENFANMLISVLAHDLRQPFATFIMFVDMIKHTQQVLSQDELYMTLENMRDTATKGIEFLDGLLYWIKTESEGYTYQTELLPLGALIDEANGLYYYEQKIKDLTLVNAIDNEQLIYAHKQMLQFINRNLLSNATKFSKTGGAINVSCTSNKGWITVAINNQGDSLSAERLERLFNIHEPGYTTGNHRIEGAGIALSICKDMINRMNGRLWAESIVGDGTTFYYSLPII